MRKSNRNDYRFPKEKIESFISMGGFIQHATEEQLCSGFHFSIIEMVEKYCKVGPGFTYVINVVYEALKERRMILKGELPDYHLDHADGETMEDYDKRLVQWYIKQTAKYEMERYSEGTSRLWTTWPVDRRTRKALSELTALEERILFLSQGMEHGYPLTEDDIANLPEFQCEGEHIQNVLNDIWNVFEEHGIERFDFEVLCERQRSTDNKLVVSN